MQLIKYLLSFAAGVYIAQNYNIPNIKVLTDRAIKAIQELEKNNDK